MALIPTRCTQCGANIEVDDSHETGRCQFCGTSFITEKVINNYNQTINIDNEEANEAVHRITVNERKYIFKIQITNEQAMEIDDLIKQNEIVKAIKIVREMTGLGLKEAKDFVDTHSVGVWNHEASDIPRDSTTSNQSSSSGCYVATCVYGSYDCPEVWTLRRFRDYTLDETWYGRLFIKCYYATSPTIVKWFGNTKWFQSFWKKRLDTMVAKLRAKGVEDTEYIDKY